MAPRIIQAEAVITARDATGETFEAIAAKVKGVTSAFKALGNVGASGIGSMNRTISRLQHTMQTLAPVASGAAAMEGARGLSGLIHETVKATAERAHEQVRMDVAGMTASEMAEAERVSGELSQKYQALSQTTIMHALRNMRAIVGTYEEAGKILEPILKLRIAAMGAHPERAGELEEDFDKLVKGMEIKGVTMDPEKFASYINGMAKAINVFGDTLKPTDYYEMFKYGRQSTQNLSEQFMLETAPTLAQELGGMSSGRAMSSFYQAIVGGRIKQQSVKELAQLGLINPDRVVRTKTGSIKGLLPGGVVGSDLAAHDPYAWVNQVLLPALQKHGITNKDAIQAVISTIFQQATAAQMAGIFATQQPRIMKDWNLVRGAKGNEAAGIYQAKDPFIAWQGLSEQLKNLLAIAGSPLAPLAAAGMHGVADGLVAIENATKGKPLLATGGLGLTLGLGALASWKAFNAGMSGVGRMLGVRGGAAAAQDLSADAAIKAMQAAQVGGAAGGAGWLASAAFSPLSIGAAMAGLEMGARPGEETYWRDRGGPGSEISALPALKVWDWLTSKSAPVPQLTGAAKPEVKGSADLNVKVDVQPSDDFISRIVAAIRNEINAFAGSGSEPGTGIGTAGSTGLSMPQAVPAP